MARGSAWRMTDNVARRQFGIFGEISDMTSVPEEDRRHLLDLSEHEWTDWTGFLRDGPLPMNPGLPEMLQRLGEASFWLAVMAEQRGVPAWPDARGSLGNSEPGGANAGDLRDDQMRNGPGLPGGAGGG
jgi:hypothetical protein